MGPTRITLADLGHALQTHGWTARREVTTLVELIRCDDPEVSLRAIEALEAISVQILSYTAQRTAQDPVCERTRCHDDVPAED